MLFPSCIRPKLSERCFEPDWNDKKRDPTIEPAPPLSRWTMVQLDYGGSVRLQPHAPLKHHLWHPFQTTIGSLGSRPCSLQHLTLPRPRFGRRATAGLPSRGRGSVWLQRLVRQAPHIISSTNSNHNSKLKVSTMHSSALYVPTATIRWSSNCLTTQSWLWECVVAAAGEASPSQTSSLASISTHNSKLRFSTLQSSALSARTATT